MQPIYIHDLSHDGRGVGRLSAAGSQDGKTCFVAGALPGEQVEWRRVKSKRSFDEGVLTSVVEASADRVEPACRHYQQCGGCELQHLDAAAQLAWKEGQLKKTVEHAGIEVVNWLPPLSEQPWHYRRRVRLAVHYAKKAPPKVGFRVKGSKDVVALTECWVMDKRLESLIGDLPDLAALLKPNGLTEIELSAADENLALCCYVKAPVNLADLANWSSRGSSSLRGSSSARKAELQIWQKLPGQQAQPLTENAPELSIDLTDKTQMSFMPTQFVQVNGAMNKAMVAQALQLAKPCSTSNVLDLFSGAGNFSLAFAEYAAMVRGVEGAASLCEQAEWNAKRAGLKNLSFQALDLFKAENFEQILCSDVNLVVLDPPRAGARQLVPWLNRLGAEKLLYISCHPATMVRDIDGLSEVYRVESMGVMDMFPHTAHLEAICLLVKR